MKKKDKRVLILILLLVSIFIYLWENRTAQMMKYRVTELQNQYDKMVSENDALRYVINFILSADNLNKIAKDNKLSSPDSSSIVEID
ncbi:MAG: hypothetical protein LBV16_05905 [Elusimicrobiota bacterium]|jgi:cell division protein FtsL|nr:hypothetical protein [Elusimicrobiota bacterium]